MGKQRNWSTLFGANLFILIILGSMFVIACIAVLALFASGTISIWETGDLESFPFLLFIAVMQILCIGVPLLLFVSIGRPGKRVLKVAKPRLSEIGLSLGMALGAYGVVLFLELLTHMLLPSFDSSVMGDIPVDTSAQLLLCIGVIAVLPAFLEEFAFRGVVLGIYEEHMGPWRAILLSSLVFGLYHLQLPLFYVYIGAGVILGWIAYRSRSVFVGVVFHFTFNLLSVLLSYLQGQLPFLFDYRLGLATLMEGRMHSALWTWGIIAAVSAVVFVLCLLAFNRITKGRTPQFVKYARHPFVDWVPLVITLAVLLLMGLFTLIMMLLASNLT